MTQPSSSELNTTAVEVFKTGMRELDPSLNSSDFQYRFNELLRNLQSSVGIDPKDHIKLQNIVFPDTYSVTSSLASYIYSTITSGGVLIGQETPFEAIGKLTDVQRRILIDSSVYKLSNSLVDKNGNLVFFPRFLGDQVLDKDRISFLNKVAECSVENPGLALKMIEDFTNPLRGEPNHELERLLPKIKFLPFKDEDIKKIVEALMILMPDGISFKSVSTRSLSNATCTSLTSGSKGVINFSFANNTAPSTVIVDDIIHEIKGVFSKYGVRNMFDVIQNLFNSMDMQGTRGSDKAFDRLLKVKGLGVANVQGIIDDSGGFVAGIGIAELCKIKIAQHLSIMNGGQKQFKEIAGCFEPLREFPKIAEYVDCKELMQNKISQQIAIEAVAIGVRALVDLILKNSQMSQNKKESILSTLENSTRIAGNAIAFGPANAILTSIVPVVSWSAKARQFFPALLENWSGDHYRASIGFTDRKETESSRREDLERRIWNTSVGLDSSKSETPISSSIRQAFFIFFTYALTDSLTSLFTKEEEEGLSYSQKMIAGIATAGASSAMMFGSNLALNCIQKYTKLGASVTGQEEAVSGQIGSSVPASTSADLVFSVAPAPAPAPVSIRVTAPAPAPAPAQL